MEIILIWPIGCIIYGLIKDAFEGSAYLAADVGRSKKKEIRSLVEQIAAGNYGEKRERMYKKACDLAKSFEVVRRYRRHVWGIGDFLPFISIRRYVKPSHELIQYIDQTETLLFQDIIQRRTEKAVDNALAVATKIKEEVLSELDFPKR